MRYAFLIAIILVPAFGLVSTAHACHASTVLAEAGIFYVKSPPHNPGPFRVRAAGQDVGFTLTDCFWTGAGAEVWQETNGIAGLQTSAHSSCGTPDTFLGSAQAAVTRQCIV